MQQHPVNVEKSHLFFLDKLSMHASKISLVSGYFTSQGECPQTMNVDNITYINANDTLQYEDSVCVQVMEPCYHPNQLLVYTNTYVSTLPSYYFNDTLIYIYDTLVIDQSATFTNCKITVGEGGVIRILTDQVLTLDSSIVQGCARMWDGIKVDDFATVVVINGSTVMDADKAIEAYNDGIIFIENSYLYNNVRGVFIDSSFNYTKHNNFINITGTTFAMPSSQLKPDFAWQQAHGIKQHSALDISDEVYTLGDNSAMNKIINMNCGVVNKRCDFFCYNTFFEKIKPDLFYGKNYDGTAIVNLGNSKVTGNTFVFSLTNKAKTILNCRRGIYTLYSNCEAYSLRIDSVINGILNIGCDKNRHVTLQDNEINATYRGINWIACAGAQYMNAYDNRIIINSNASNNAGIAIEDFIQIPGNYDVQGNSIVNNNGLYGIYASYVTDAQIKFNDVRLNNATNNSAMNGISIKACSGVNASCNTITSNMQNDALRNGVEVVISTQNNIECNTIDSVGVGIYVGGYCSSPQGIRGNNIGNGYCGIYINSAGVTGLQTHAGNIWTGTYSSGFGGANINAASLNNLLLSLFTVNNTLPNTYKPVIPLNVIDPPFYVDDNGWFDYVNIGSTFGCASTNICSEDHERITDSSAVDDVLEDSIFSRDYIPETRAMAERYVYIELENDSALKNSDQNYADFIGDKADEPVGKLFDVNEKLKETEEESYFQSQIYLNDSLIRNLLDSIRVLDSANKENVTALYLSQRSAFISSINFTYTLNNSYNESLSQLNQTLIIDAEAINQTVNGSEHLFENEKEINIIRLAFAMDDIESIRQNQMELISIANQCPYTGGEPVLLARNYLSFIDDSITYDDANLCLEQGIYKTIEELKYKTSHSISIIPNPAKNHIEIIFGDSACSKCELILYNHLKQKIALKILNYNKNAKRIDVSALAGGIYFLQIINENGIMVTKKFIKL